VPDATDTYAFGRDEVAARRLSLLHEVFEPTSRALLEEVRSLGSHSAALDLGCGPGFTTRLVADVVRPERLTGIDAAEAFLERARRHVPTATFVAHDLTQPPLPGAPADLLYARYVLGHLGDVERHLAAWAAELTPYGLLVVEDNEWIDVPQPAFARYLELSREVMAAQHADLYPGARLAAPEAHGPLRAVLSRVVEVSPPSATVACMFRLNLGAWSRRPAARPHAAELDRLERELDRLAESPAGGEITWGIRQLVLVAPVP
jgi:trans-aconitate 2-methyltransferase